MCNGGINLSFNQHNNESDSVQLSCMLQVQSSDGTCICGYGMVEHVYTRCC